MVEDVSDAKTFKYHIAQDPGVDSGNSDFAAGYFARIWRAQRVALENNVFELSGWFGDEASPAAMEVASVEIRQNPYTFFHFLPD